MPERVAVVTGSNKGIGYEIVRGLLRRRAADVVYLTSRDDGRGQAAVAKLKKEGLRPHYHQLDVVDPASVCRFRDHIQSKHRGIDILINNAAVASNLDFYNTYDEAKTIVQINFRSILTIQELLFPLLNDGARVVNISSDCGHLSNVRNKYWLERLSSKDLKLEDINEFVEWFLNSLKDGTFKKEDFADNGTLAAYRVSKVALSAITMLQQKELEGRGITVNSMHPGLVRTDMTNGTGFYSAEQSADTPLWLALDAPPSLKGAYVWYDKKVIEWYDLSVACYFKTQNLTLSSNSSS